MYIKFLVYILTLPGSLTLKVNKGDVGRKGLHEEAALAGYRGPITVQSNGRARLCSHQLSCHKDIIEKKIETHIQHLKNFHNFGCFLEFDINDTPWATLINIAVAFSVL